MNEDIRTEFKQTVTEDLKYAIIAMANTEGGMIYVGINDDGTVCGITNPDDTILKITNMIRDAIKPDVTLFTRCSIETVNNKAVVCISVQRGMSRPYYLAGKGIRPEGVFVRQGASSVPASSTAIHNMIRESAGDIYEDALSIDQELTFISARAFFEKMNISFQQSHMRTLGLLNSDAQYTNLGQLLSDQNPFSIKLACFQGIQKGIFKDRSEAEGSIFDQLEKSFEFIERYNSIHAEVRGLYREDRRSYPPEALREALLNALIHRDYAVNAPILISIYDNRIEIVNIGGLTKGISYNDLSAGISVLRNKKLGNVFYRLKLIEAFGTGLAKIREYYAEYPCVPEILVTDNAFRITLYDINYFLSHSETEASANNVIISQSLSENEKKVLQLLHRQNLIERLDIEHALSLSSTQSGVLLRKMCDKGLLIRDLHGRKYIYRKA